MEADAKAYEQLNKPQYESGCEFVRSLKISEGSKVLDMGCGTGDVTNFIASLVGPGGLVVGVDPDETRIKIAQEKFKDAPNLRFIVGDSSNRLPCEEQEYYDLHFSSNSFQWLLGDDKKVYLTKAYQCLKQGGNLAILTGVKSDTFSPEGSGLAVEFLYDFEYKRLCEEHLFTNVITEMVPLVARFSSLEQYKAWFRATTHQHYSECNPAWAKSIEGKVVRTEDDGSITVDTVDLLGLRAEKNA